MLISAILAVGIAAGATGAQQPADQTLTQVRRFTAIGSYRDAQRLLEQLGKQTTLTALQRAAVDQQLAAVYSQTGAADLALTYADRADHEARSVGAFDLLARIEGVRGIVWLYRGRSAETLNHLNQSLAWAQKSRDRDLITTAYTRLAVAHQDLGDSTRALDMLNRSLEVNPHPPDAARVQYLTRRGLVEAELHEAGSAKANIRQALDITRRIGDRRSEAQVLIDLARTCERFDPDWTQAIAFAAQAVVISSEIQVPVLEIAARNQLGTLLRQTGHLTEARANLERAVALITGFNEHRDEPYVLKNLGQVLSRLGFREEGEAMLRRAASRADANNLTRIRWIARFELAQMHVLNDPSAADREFQEALAILEEQQTNVLLEGFRAGALDETLAEFDPYDHYIRFLLDRGDSSRAFHVAERQRARAFLDTLSTTRDTLARDVSVKFSNAERQILERIKSAQAILRTDTIDDVSRAELVARVGVYENELTQLRLRLAVERPALAHARYPKLWQVSELQSKLLASDESLLSLYLGANRSVAWIVAPDRLSTITLPPAKDVETFVRAALEELRNPLARDRASLVALSRALSVDRIVKTAQGKRLIVVPHGILYDVPFEALLDDSGRPLVERFAVSYAPSASSLAFLRSAPSRGPAQVSLLGVANPVVAGARLTGKRQVDLTHINLLEPVPHSGDEVRAIAALFGRSARILEGPRATRTELRTAGMEQSRILHFATHGLIDENRPERSGLVLTADPPRDDGLLQMRDIYSLRLNADLVTLSACETALGRHVTGEGIIGLTRAFFYAGAHTVVASLWDVDDAAASRLMQRFYENLHSGQPIDFALQRAKLDFIRAGGPTASPFYWASFVATGNARAAIEVPPASPVPRIAIAAIALLIAGMLSWSAAARRRRGVRKAAASYRTP